jgi:hypothetical protein
MDNLVVLVVMLIRQLILALRHNRHAGINQ